MLSCLPHTTKFSKFYLVIFVLNYTQREWKIGYVPVCVPVPVPEIEHLHLVKLLAWAKNLLQTMHFHRISVAYERFLSPEKRNKLKLHHKQERDKRVCDRIKAVLLADKGWSFQQIAEVLLLRDEAISQHLQDYLASQKL